MIKKIQTSYKVKSEDFLSFMEEGEREELLSLAEQLRGKKVLHVNATPVGGGVAEILVSFIAYARSLGIEADWYAIDADKVPNGFFAFTNRLHNALQGADIIFTSKEWQVYEDVCRQIAKDLDNLDYDIVVIHDPQPLGAAKYLSNDASVKIARMHIDTSSPNRGAWQKIFPYFNFYKKVIFSNSKFVNGDIQESNVFISAPAIDPLSPKQTLMPIQEAKKYLNNFGVKSHSPLIVQVSRFDVWKNPYGLIEAHKEVLKKYPQAQLAFVGLNAALDNPEASRIYNDVKTLAECVPNTYPFFYSEGINIPEFTMYAQNAADVIVQNSIREGFGMTVTEAMWKGKPVIGGDAFGIKEQIEHGRNGFIASNSCELASKICYLLDDQSLSFAIGKGAKESVRKRFLLSRLVRDHLSLYARDYTAVAV